MGLTRFLFRLARLSAHAKAVSSGDPTRIERRMKNRLIGRTLSRAGIWRRLWR